MQLTLGSESIVGYQLDFLVIGLSVRLGDTIALKVPNIVTFLSLG